MNEENVIILFTAIQILSYIILDKYGLRDWKYFILGLLLISNIFVLPRYFFPDLPKDEPRCGMPELMSTLFFWIFGCGVTILIHVTYLLGAHLIQHIHLKKKKTLRLGSWHTKR
jgi:hypothetical protein